MSILDVLKKKKEPRAAEPTKIAPTMAKPKKAEVAKTEVSAGKVPVISRQILLAPIISEKAAHLASGHQYVFEVADWANKIMIKEAVRAAYNVQPIDVKIIKVAGKTVKRGRKVGKKNDYKKAIVILKPGQTIEMYEGV